MASLPVVAVIRARTGSEKQIQKALSALVEPTRSEPGYSSCELFVSAADRATFITVEPWRSQAGLDLQAPHVQQTLGAAGDHLAQAPAIYPLSPVRDS